MKKIITVVLVGVLVSSLTYAGGRDAGPKSVSGMAVVKRDASSYKIIYKSEEASDVKVQIFDAKSKLVFSETIKHSDGFSRPYNFGNLAEGAYTFKLDNGTNWLTETVDYHVQAAKAEKLAHITRLETGKYLLSVIGRGEDRIKVSILDEQGSVIHKDSQAVYGDFAQVYDLSQVKGPFSFEITDKSGASVVLK